MRARNLKPSIFKNELLAVADPLYTVVFEGLWCLADREGRLEDRPAKIHFDINPGRAFETTERSLAWLHENGFIVRYEVGKIRYIQVITFEKHQNPHQKEPPSKIPAHAAVTVQEPGKPGASPVQASEEHSSGPADSLFSDSGLRTPESPFPLPDCVFPEVSGIAREDEKPRVPPDLTEPEHHAHFERIKAAYPRRTGKQDPITFEHNCRTLVDRGHTWDELIAAAQRYNRYCAAGGVSGPQYIMAEDKFFAPNGSLWTQDWTPPPTKADQRLSANLDAAAEAKRRLFGSAT